MNEIVLVELKNIDHNRFQLEGVKDEPTVLEIASSLKQHKDNGTRGLNQLPTARKVDGGRYELAFGHHRFYAFELNAVDDPFFNFMPLFVRDLSDIEMFEMMGIENFHRRDISPIEEANIFRSYMTNFNKTSVQTAQKFEKTDEYVRASVRMLNLPEPALKMIDSGELNKSAARDLLVAEKLGGADLVQEAIKEMQENPDDTPARNIEDALRMSKKTAFIDMGQDCFSGKKFPVKHLAKLTAKEIHELIDFDMTGHEGTIDDVIKEMMVLISSGMEIVDSAFPMVTPESLERLRVLVNPSQCGACAFHAVLSGTHFCGLTQCRERKVAAWREKENDDEVKKIGIPMYQKSDGPMVALSWRESADEKLVKARGVDLRLIPSQGMWNNFDGIGPKFKVVLVGPTAEKRLNKAETEGKKVETQREREERERAMRDVKRTFLDRFEWEVAAPGFECLLDGVGSFAFLERMSQEIDCVLPDDLDFDDLVKSAKNAKKADGLRIMRRICVFSLIEPEQQRVSSWNQILEAKKSILDYAKDFQKIAEKWDVTLPKDFTQQAESFQAELDTALGEGSEQALKANEIKKAVHSLIDTSVEDMESSLRGNEPFSLDILQKAYETTSSRGDKTKAKILQQYIKKAKS